MNVALLAFGTRGDVQPFIALGLGLQKTGHQVTLVTQSRFCDMAARHALSCTPVNADVRLPSQKGTTTGRLSPFAVYRLTREYLQQTFNDVWQICQEVDSLIFSDWARLPAVPIIEKLQIPGFMVLLHPQQMQFLYRETHVFGPPFTPLISWIRKQILWQFVLKGMINAWRRQVLTLPSAPLWGSEKLLKAWKTPAFFAHSPVVFPQPDTWPAWFHTSGYLFLNHAPDWVPPSDLVEFLATGPPPVLMGFSSMSNRKVKNLTDVLLRALSQTGQRGIILGGWSKIGHAQQNTADIFAIDAIPYDWLFPQVAAVVHHGGAGSTAVGFSAGIPQVIIPFAVDQPFWAWRASELGVGPEPLPPDTLTTERLAHAITSAVQDTAIRQRAAKLGEQIRAEDGIGNAVALFENYVHRK